MKGAKIVSKTRYVRFDPAKAKAEYDIIVENGNDELVWIWPSGALAFEVTIDKNVGHQPVNGGPTPKDKILDRGKIKDIKDIKGIGEFKYDISVTYPGGTLSFDPTVKILP